jgi:type I restriction enzyme S subunit
MGYARAGNITQPVLAIGRVGALCGNIHEISPPAWISDNALQLQSCEGFSLKYLAVVLHSRNLNDIASKTAQPLITGTQVQDQRLPLPAIDEQEAIVRFLHRETAKHDALITEQRTLIDLLKEKRQAIISHAVTKGLDPDVAMKDSGVEWLGEVPAHWEILRLKQVIKEGSSISYGIVQPGDPQDFGIPFVQTTNMTSGAFDLEGLQKTTKEIEALYPRSRLIGGEVILGIRASIGSAYVVPHFLAGANLSRGVARICCDKNIFPEFLVDVFASRVAENYWQLLKQGSTFNEVSIETVREFCFAFPSLEEQMKIHQYLDEEKARLEALTAEAETTIALLQERRSALISAAVTGKIDVRQAA